MRGRQWARLTIKVVLFLSLPLIGFAAVKGYYWYQVRSAVEQLAQQLSLVAKLEYGSIETGFDGVAGVRDLVLTPLDLSGIQAQALSIDAVRIRGSSWLDLIKIQSRLDKGELPQTLGIEISGMRVNLDDARLNQLAAELSASQALVGDAPIRSWMLGCEAAVEGLTGPQLMQKLGYQHLVLDLSADYLFDRSRKLLSVVFSQSVRDQFETELSVSLDLGINEFNRYNLGLASPSLGDIKLQYLDRSLKKRYIQFCATAASESAAQFVDRHINLVTAKGLELGLQVSDPLIEGYRDFLLGAGELRLQLLRGSQLWPASLLQYSPDQLLRVLAPELTVNGDPIEPLSIRWEPQEDAGEPLREQLRSGVEAFTALLQSPFVEPVPEPVVLVDPSLLVLPVASAKGLGYRTVAIDALQQYIGADIRIETKNGNLVAGRLLSVEWGELRVYQELGIGDAILPIAFKHVETVRVFH